MTAVSLHLNLQETSVKPISWPQSKTRSRINIGVCIKIHKMPFTQATTCEQIWQNMPAFNWPVDVSISSSICKLLEIFLVWLFPDIRHFSCWNSCHAMQVNKKHKKVSGTYHCNEMGRVGVEIDASGDLCVKNWPLNTGGRLRTFARKIFNIDFFLKLLPL